MSSASPDPMSIIPKAQSAGTDDDTAGSPTTPGKPPHAKHRTKAEKERDRERPKYTRLLQSCDACRARKVRCVQLEGPDADNAPLTLGPNGAKKQPFCKPCMASTLPCTFNFKAKKRGPPSQHVKRLKADAAATAPGNDQDAKPMDMDLGDYASRRDAAARSALPMHTHQSSTSSSGSPPATLPSLRNMMSHTHNGSEWGRLTSPENRILPRLLTEDSRRSGMPVLPSPTAIFPPMLQPTHQSEGSLPTPTSFGLNLISPISSSVTYAQQSPPQPSALESASRTSPGDETNTDSSPHTMAALYSPHSHYSSNTRLPNGDTAQHHSQVSDAAALAQDTFRVSLAANYNGLPGARPAPRPTTSWSLATLAPTSTILHVLSLFFDFVWPLTPCIHRPSFYADLGEKREERDPLFFALVCSTIASTLVQVPLSYLPMDRKEVRRLARRFNEASGTAANEARDPPSSTMVIIRYFDNIYHFREGHEGSSNAAFGDAVYTALVLHMHREEGYEGLDHIESEVRKRTFWLLYGADKSIASMHPRPCTLRDEDCTVNLPTEVDDEFITARAVLPQPPNKTPIISGFIYITRIFRYIGEMVSIIRRDRWRPPSGLAATSRLEEVCEIHHQITSIFDNAPPELRLRSGSTRRGSVSAGKNSSVTPYDFGSGGAAVPDFDGAGFAEAAIAEVNHLFDDPNANKEDAGNAFLVMQANVHVTQHVARLQAEQHRHWLVTLIRDSGMTIQSPTAAAEVARGGWTADDREGVAKDLLNVLHSIPILSITTNGPSLVHKVRFVASTLLDSIREAETAPTPAARALTYLWDFLAILSEIEKNYSLNDEIDPPQPTSTDVAP